MQFRGGHQRRHGRLQLLSAGSRERGIFSLVEVLLATVVLALAATSTAYWVETVGNLGRDADEQTIAGTVLKTVEATILPKAFREPGSTSFGPESGEALQIFDDVDDFHRLASSPPFDSNLAPLTALVDWRIEVAVEIVDPATLEVVANSDLRRIRVAVLHKGNLVAETWWLRARSPLE